MFSRILIASVLPAVSMLTPSPPLDNNAVQTSPLGYLLTADKDPHSGQQVTSASAAHRESGVTCSYTPWHADGMKNGGLEWVDPASSPGGVPKGKAPITWSSVPTASATSAGFPITRPELLA